MTKAEFDAVNWNKDTKVKLKGNRYSEYFSISEIDFIGRNVKIFFGEQSQYIISEHIESVR